MLGNFSCMKMCHVQIKALQTVIQIDDSEAWKSKCKSFDGTLGRFRLWKISLFAYLEFTSENTYGFICKLFCFGCERKNWVWSENSSSRLSSMLFTFCGRTFLHCSSREAFVLTLNIFPGGKKCIRFVKALRQLTLNPQVDIQLAASLWLDSSLISN